MNDTALRITLASLLVAGGVACHKNPKPTPVADVAPTPPPPAPMPEPTPVPEPSEYERVRALDPDAINQLGLFTDVRFDFDRADIRDSERPRLNEAAETLRKFDFLVLQLEGHCDERGTAEYNLALGDRRARAVQEYLVVLGVPASRLRTVSYGKEVPLCRDSSEECWARNRRTAFNVVGKVAD